MATNTQIFNALREEIYNFLSENLGLEPETMKAFLKGKKRNLSSVEFLMIAQNLGIDLNEFTKRLEVIGG
ncbi:hypothetical protein IJ674_06905 [bacterium]|nr:hypothetical protein [bacterium]